MSKEKTQVNIRDLTFEDISKWHPDSVEKEIDKLGERNDHLLVKIQEAMHNVDLMIEERESNSRKIRLIRAFLRDKK